MKRPIVEKKLEHIMLAEAGTLRDLMADIQNYEILKRIAVEEPASVTEEELGAAKEAILERWPDITDIEAALDSSGNTRTIEMRRLISEGKQRPRVRPTNRRAETPDEKAARIAEKLTRLKVKANGKKDKKPK